MKKILSLVLAMILVLSMAACTPTDNNKDNTEDQTKVPASALEVLQNIWALYGEEEKFFAMGGDSNNTVDNAPGAVDLTNADFLTYNLLVPADEHAKVTEAASLVHAMNANTFTGAAYKVADAEAFANTMKTAVMGNQWMCGFPETLLVVSFGGGYVLVAYGINDAINPFKTHMTTAYPDAKILINEAITG